MITLWAFIMISIQDLFCYLFIIVAKSTVFTVQFYSFSFEPLTKETSRSQCFREDTQSILFSVCLFVLYGEAKPTYSRWLSSHEIIERSQYMQTNQSGEKLWHALY